VLAALDGLELAEDVKTAAELLATVLGQDLEQREDGVFRIARRVAVDRVISTVDPEARHGHKTKSRKFDGYKGHVAIDPDSEIITATVVTPGNTGDGAVAVSLLNDVIDESERGAVPTAETIDAGAGDAVADVSDKTSAMPPGDSIDLDSTAPDDSTASDVPASASDEALDVVQPSGQAGAQPVEVYGDASYGTAEVVEQLEAAGIEPYTKMQPPCCRGGRFSQDAFGIDTDKGTVRCPTGFVVSSKPRKDGSALARFGKHCKQCPQRDRCTTSKTGRAITVHAKHDTLKRTRARQADPQWQQRYRCTRPKVERKIGHMMVRKHGGRRARVRGRRRIGQDFSVLAAATNLKRLAMLSVRWSDGAWSSQQ
jgi:hypothetical protein